MKYILLPLLIATMSLVPMSAAIPEDPPSDEFAKIGYLAYSCAEVSESYDEFRKCITIEIKTILEGEGVEIKSVYEDKDDKEDKDEKDYKDTKDDKEKKEKKEKA
ncbi:hypothetical protein BBP40_008736 [Aspergillus hancockii]|nr:hypothetical protein BBP40_008736 [Aspergillus hancockii]